jgi:hypothetical protein
LPDDVKPRLLRENAAPRRRYLCCLLRCGHATPRRGCFVLASADDARRLGVVLAKVGERFGIARIEGRSSFQFCFDALGEAVCLYERNAVCFFAQCATVPEMVVAAVAVERDSLLTRGDGVLPSFELQRDAAEQLFCFGIIFVGCRCGLKKLEGGVGATLLEIAKHVDAAFRSESRRAERDEQGCEQ